jgi:thioredoxin 1
VLLAIALAASSIGASAGERVPFDRAAFDTALKAGQPILIDISATWCPTCQRQKAILSELTRKSKYAGFTIFEVDYDTGKHIMRSFGAQRRSRWLGPRPTG